MRAFRNSLRQTLLFVLVLSATEATASESATLNEYFPLAVGKSWTYQCSAEGTPQLRKTIAVTKVHVVGNRKYFQTELRVGKDRRAVTSYYAIDEQGLVKRSQQIDSKEWEAMLGLDLTPGTKYGEWNVGSKERVRVPALRNVEAVKLETFSMDTRGLTDEKRAEWMGRYYVKGVGLVAEADGIGGSCELIKYVK